MISVEDLALTTLAVVFGTYALFCAALCGVSLVKVFPKLSHPAKHHRLDKPSWEAGNAFVLLGLGGFALIFNAAFEILGPQIDYLIILGLTAVLVRAALLFWIARQTKASLVTRPIKVLFLVASLTVPLCLAASGAYLLYGEQFWQTPDAWLAVLSAAVGVIAAGLCLVVAKKMVLRLSAAVWLLIFGCLWPLSLEMTGSHLLDYWFGLWLSFVIVVISVVVVTDGLAKRNYIRLAVPGLAFLSIPLLASANNPYLVYNQITTSAAFSAGSWQDLLVVGCLATWALVVYGLWVVFKLSEPKKTLRSKF